MITLESNRLVFRFPEVHERAEFSLEFQRTLRTPDDGKTYPLPAGLGSFPLIHVDDYASALPRSLAKRGGVLLPIWPSEAMWVNFSSGSRYPLAVKIATGKINAITGKPWTEALQHDPQDYMVIPNQPWLDGYCVTKGIVRQFVAARLGDGVTVEEQIAGMAQYGGLQVIAFPMKHDAYERLMRIPPPNYSMHADECLEQMGLAPGGKIRQEVYEDPYGIDCWDQSASSRCFVSMVNAECWKDLTGMAVPTSPISRDQYTSAGLPWFDYYDGRAKAVQGSSVFNKVKSIFGGKEESISMKGKPLSVGESARPVREFDREAANNSDGTRLRDQQRRLRQLSEAIAYIQDQIAEAIALLSEEDDEPSRGSKTILKVRYCGELIIRQHASDTLAEVIRRIGLDKVRGLALKLGGRSLVGTLVPEDRGYRKVDGWIVATHASNADKKLVLEEIARRLSQDIEVEVVQPVAA